MNRRDWLKITGATGIAASFPTAPILASPRNASSQPLSVVNVDLKRLNLQHTWTTTMSSSQYRDTLHVAYTRERHHRPRRGRAHRALPRGRGRRPQGGGIGASRCCSRSNPMQFSKLMAERFPAGTRRVGGQSLHRYRPHGLGRPEAGYSALHLFRAGPQGRAYHHFLHRH